MPPPNGKHIHGQGLPGYDGIADFTLCVHRGKAPICVNCQKYAWISIKYKNSNKGPTGIENGLWLRFKVKVQETLLKKPTAVLCHQCWPKFQRQVVHIADSGMRKAKEAA